jgi:hypothetical protein
VDSGLLSFHDSSLQLAAMVSVAPCGALPFSNLTQRSRAGLNNFAPAALDNAKLTVSSFQPISPRIASTFVNPVIVI